MPADRPVALSDATRADHLERLRSTTADDPLDVLVVGGGVNGAGAAFDAATRGLNVGLVEAADWASGTSSRSSKLMHGGLRYLQMLDFSLVAEALRERDRLLRRTAPHLVHPISFVFPFFRRAFDRAFIGSGVALYDAMQTVGRKRAVPFHKHLSRRGMLERFGGLDGDKAVGAIEYFDAHMDDARFVLMLVRSAVEHGAAATSYTRVLDYLRDGDDIIGARVRDETTGEELDVHARATILAGGVWTGEQQDLVGSEQGLQVQASKGVHLVVPRERIPAAQDVGVITQTEKSVLFIIPSDEYWVIGTTDTPWETDVDDVATTATDIDYILEHANAVLDSDLTHDDIIGTFAGLRPLVQPVRSSDTGSAKVSREHTVMQVAPGLSAIAGGKYTTYRVMAEDVVDFAIQDVFPGRRSVTEVLPILGGQGFAEAERDSGATANRFGLDAVRMERLLFRYGTLVRDVLEPAEADGSLVEPLAHAPRYLRAEVLYAAQEEGVIHLADVMKRRLRLDYEVRDRGSAAAAEIAEIIGPELGWDQARTDAEVAAYRAHADARLAAEKVTRDEEAARLIADAPEVPELN